MIMVIKSESRHYFEPDKYRHAKFLNTINLKEIDPRMLKLFIKIKLENVNQKNIKD